MNNAWLIARTDVMFQLKERATLVWLFAMPLLFFYFIGTVTAGFGGGGISAKRPLLVETAQDGGAVLQALIQRLGENQFDVQLHTFNAAKGEALAEASGRRLAVPAGFGDLTVGAEPATLRLTVPEPGPTAQLDQLRVLRAAYTALADLVVFQEQGQAPTDEAFKGLANSPRSLHLEVETAGHRRRIPTGFEQAIPGTLVMFTLLILLTSGAVQLVIERERGQLRRLAAAPMSRGQIVLGKWAGKLGLGLVQIGFALAAGTVLFGMDWGPDLPMVAGVLVGWAAFCASLALLLATLTRTQAQASGMGTLASLTLAALGGAWWPIEVTPGFMQALQKFLPSGWAMDALHQLISFQAGAQSALPHVAGLLGGALVLGWAASRRFRFQ